jgi:hypothetical protein
MAKFAPVCPIWLARKLAALDLLGDYHLLLAHDIVKNQKGYDEVFGLGFRQRNPQGSFIILDNSMIELGHPASDDTIDRACQIVQPDVVVLPDYAHDSEKTVSESVLAYNRWHRSMITSGFMAVAQGNTLEEYVKCALSLIEMRLVTHIGIPRNAVSKLHSRFQLIQAVRESTMNHPRPQIHLLGFSEDVLDDVTCASLPFVKGIDSTTPLRAGLDNMWMTSPFSYEEFTSPRGNYWDEEKPVTTALIQNLQRMRTWLEIPN